MKLCGRLRIPMHSSWLFCRVPMWPRPVPLSGIVERWNALWAFREKQLSCRRGTRELDRFAAVGSTLVERYASDVRLKSNPQAEQAFDVRLKSNPQQQMP